MKLHLYKKTTTTTSSLLESVCSFEFFHYVPWTSLLLARNNAVSIYCQCLVKKISQNTNSCVIGAPTGALVIKLITLV